MIQVIILLEHFICKPIHLGGKVIWKDYQEIIIKMNSYSIQVV